MLRDLNQRSIDVFRHVVQAYMETGQPIGSKLICDRLDRVISSATVRHVMFSLEQMGLLYAPHTSAGRLPTEVGLRFFVNGLLETHTLTPAEQGVIQERCTMNGKNLKTILEDAASTLAGISRCAGFVVSPRLETSLQHIEFVQLTPQRLLVIMVTGDCQVENRVMEVEAPLPRHVLNEISDYLNTLVAGKTLKEAFGVVQRAFESSQSEIDSLSQKLISAGLACWANLGPGDDNFMVLQGQAHLLEDISLEDDLERLRHLFAALETRKTGLNLLEAAAQAEGVQIFIGAHNHLFQHQGCSMIVAPYRGADRQVVGAIGVIGPVRINYGKIIPMVDYTAQMISDLLAH